MAHNLHVVPQVLLHAPNISEVPLSKLADSVFSVGFDCEMVSRGGRGGIGAAKDQDVGTGGRLEVESGNGGGDGFIGGNCRGFYGYK